MAFPWFQAFLLAGPWFQLFLRRGAMACNKKRLMSTGAAMQRLRATGGT